jgi:cell division transport system permease protein
LWSAWPMNIFYFMKEAFRGFFQAKLMTFVSVITIGLTLFFLGCVFVGYLNIKLWLKNAANRVEAVVYIDDATSSDSLSLANCVEKVKECPQVATAVIVDKKTAWNRFKELYGTAMLEAVDENPFPVSIELTLRGRSQSSDAATALQKELELIKGVDDVQLSQQWVAILQKFRNYFLVATICIALILLVALHFMISNTIKLTIYGRKELVRNMHFVGAAAWYIKMPFILEGLLQGIVGGALGVLALYVVKISLQHFPIYWGHWWLFFLLFPIGALFGCVGSMSAVRKFLVS